MPMPSPTLRRLTFRLCLAALVLTSGRVFAQVKQPEPPKKPDPLVLKLESAQKGKSMGEEVLLVSGVEPLSGLKKTFAVENQAPQNPRDPRKYDPSPRVKEEVDKVKPGEYIKIVPKAPRNGNYGGGNYGRNTTGQVEWIDEAEPYTVTEHETEPGTFLFDGAFLDDLEEGGQKIEVYSIELVKLGRVFKCLAPMVPDGKKMVPDPAVVALGDALMVKYKALDRKAPKMVIEATISPQGNFLFVTAIDEYQAPRTANFVKLTDADVNGNKGQAVELDEGGKTVTLLLPGKMSGKKWVTDFAMLSFAKKAKPGAQVVFKTRDVEQKSFVRSLAAAPKDKDGKKETAGVEMKK